MSTGGLAGSVLAWSEKEFQEQVVAGAKSLGWLVYHTHDSRRSEPGFPDLVLVQPVRGRVLFRELKTQKGRTTQAQDTWIEALTRAGQDAAIWRPSDWESRDIHRALVVQRA
ncbi:VRR-NUC domain-containing protein [Arthrobacter sp. JSM 101049]|uniref:VRR-NUC domain-containing protein n=1 Tax=Arthrobacter sp. JSM 101049 TaxID=929097 RepID=UPI0035689BD6